MRNVTASCLKHNLRLLVSTPRAWAVLILTLLFIQNQFDPIRMLLVDEGRAISFFGLNLYLFNDATVTMMAGLALLLLLLETPITDESQRYIAVRSGRGAWGRGQLIYVFVMVFVYLVIFSLFVLFVIWPWADWSGGWSSALDVLVNEGAYEYYDTMLDYDPWLMRVFTPLGGMGLTLILHYLAFLVVVLIQYCANISGLHRISFLIAAAPLIFDEVIGEFFGEYMIYFSPVTLSRLSMLDYGDEMGRPPIWYAFVVLIALVCVLSAVCMRLSKRKEISL